MEPTTSKETDYVFSENQKEVEEYKQQVEEEIEMYKAVLNKAEILYKEVKSKPLGPVKLSETQQSFFDECPNYVEYLKTVIKFHKLVNVKQLKQYEEVQANMSHWNDTLINALKAHYNM